MASRLHLVKGVEREIRELQNAAGEDRYRYPSHEEIWEVSCEPDEPSHVNRTAGRPKATLHRFQSGRRAS